MTSPQALIREREIRGQRPVDGNLFLTACKGEVESNNEAEAIILVLVSNLCCSENSSLLVIVLKRAIY